MSTLPALIPRDVLFGNPERAAPQISPDGKRLAYLAPDEGVLNVWVRTLGQNDDRVVTSDRKRGVRIYFWQADSDHILYMQDQDGDENFHVYQTNLETRATRDLTPFLGARAQPVAVSPEHPDEILVGLNVRDLHLHDVYRVSLKTGAVEMDTENPGDVVGWHADHDMQVRIAQAMTPDGGREVRTREHAKSEWRTLLTFSQEDSFSSIADFTPDNEGLYALSSIDANAARLVEITLASGATRVLAEDSQYDVDGILTHPRTHALEAVEFTRARSEWTVLDDALKADFDTLSRVHNGDLNIISRDLNDTIWTVAYLMDDGPVYYYTYDRATKQTTLLFSNQPALEQYKLSKMQPVAFPASDGMMLHGYLTCPIGLEPKNLPLVLFVHGGPWARDTWGLNPSVQHLANRGYAVLQINFRGSTGYGKAFVNAGDKEWAAKMHTDLLDGKQWAIAQGVADPNKVAIMGGSYGGYATLVGLTFTPEEFICGVDIVGPSNLITLMQTIPPYWEPMKALFTKRVGDPETEEALLIERSPFFKADRITKPLLIAQGANDPRVKQSESDQIVAAMRKNNQPVEYLVFPDEGHGFARPENRLKFSAATEAFLAQYLGGRAEPPSEAEEVDELRR